MELYLDTSDLNAVEELWPILPLSGVTTNPNIVAKGARPPRRAPSRDQGHRGAGGRRFSRRCSPARPMPWSTRRSRCATSIPKLVVKIPALPAGFAAIKSLSTRGVATLGTAVFAPMQGFFAALAGARYVAPYVNSVDAGGGDGARLARDLQGLLDLHCPSCAILAASFRTPQQVLGCPPGRREGRDALSRHGAPPHGLGPGRGCDRALRGRVAQGLRRARGKRALVGAGSHGAQVHDLQGRARHRRPGPQLLRDARAHPRPPPLGVRGAHDDRPGRLRPQRGRAARVLAEASARPRSPTFGSATSRASSSSGSSSATPTSGASPRPAASRSASSSTPTRPRPSYGGIRPPTAWPSGATSRSAASTRSRRRVSGPSSPARCRSPRRSRTTRSGFATERTASATSGWG